MLFFTFRMEEGWIQETNSPSSPELWSGFPKATIVGRVQGTEGEEEGLGPSLQTLGCYSRLHPLLPARCHSIKSKE